MSDWTYIRGCMELSCSAFESKCKEPEPFPWRNNLSEEELEVYRAWMKKWRKGLYLPYPEEQFKITTPLPMERVANFSKTKKEEPKLETVMYVEQATVYSLPRARKYLDEAFKLLDQGEVGFRYAIKQDAYDGTMTTCCHWEFDEPCLKKYYEDAINKLYKNDDKWYSWNFKDLVKYKKLDKACSVFYADSMVIGIVESLRWCTASELESGLEKFFKYLWEHNFDINTVYLEWHDTVDGLIYKCELSSQFDELVFEHINNEGKVIYRKVYYYPTDLDGYIDYDSPDYDKRHPLVREENLEA